MSKKTTKKKTAPAEDSELVSGYALERGMPYHFDHIDEKEANNLADGREIPHVVETINWTFAKGNRKQVHHNKYFAYNLTEAIALAGRIEMHAQDCAEQVILIRPALDEAEWNEMRAAFNHFDKHTPPAVAAPDQE